MTAKQKPLSLAFLGCGFATRLHSRTLSKLDPGVRRFYASRDGARAEAYSRKYGGAGHFDSYDAAIDDPAIDAVLVATPPSSHLDLTLRALQANTDVIVEKPPFRRALDFNTVQDALADTSRRVLVAENYFYKPLTATLRQALQDGAVGDVLFVHVNALKQQRVDDWRDAAETSCGGALFEGGIHWISLLASLGLEVESISGARAGSAEGLERSVAVTIRYVGGTVGTLLYSWEVPSLFKGLRLSRIFGREGSITFESNGLFVLIRGRRRRLVSPGIRDIAGYRAMFRDFLAALRGEKEPEYTLELARRDLDLVEAAYRAMGSRGQAAPEL